MKVFVNPHITITVPKKNKNFGYYTIIEKDTPDRLKIKAKSASGRERGIVGEILKDGTVISNDIVSKFITPEVRKKAKLILALIPSTQELILERGLVRVTSK